MKIFSSILDRLLTAPGETPGQALVQRPSSQAPARPQADSAGKPRLTGRDRKPKPAAPPATVYLLLDVSSSMTISKLRQATDGGISFAENAVSKGYRVGVIHFSVYAKLRTEPTKDLRQIERGLRMVGLQLTTNMAGAIELGTQQLERIKGQRAMVLVTDGYPDNAEATLEAAEAAKRRDITIIAIGTDDADHHFLKKLASASGLATVVPSSELKVAIASAARLLPAKSSGSK